MGLFAWFDGFVSEVRAAKQEADERHAEKQTKPEEGGRAQNPNFPDAEQWKILNAPHDPVISRAILRAGFVGGRAGVFLEDRETGKRIAER